MTRKELTKTIVLIIDYLEPLVTNYFSGLKYNFIVRRYILYKIYNNDCLSLSLDTWVSPHFQLSWYSIDEKNI